MLRGFPGKSRSLNSYITQT